MEIELGDDVINQKCRVCGCHSNPTFVWGRDISNNANARKYNQKWSDTDEKENVHDVSELQHHE